MYEAGDAARLASLGDSRMWRLLLARLHPDAGGDHDLFAFACAMKDEMSGVTYPANGEGSEKNPTMDNAAPFLRTWQQAMGHWASSNRKALTSFRVR